MKNLMSLAVVLSLIALTACGRPAGSGSASGGNVAVIDLDKIARDMGWIDAMQQNLQTADAQLKNQIQQLITEATKQIEDAKKLVITEAKLTEEQIKILNNAKDDRDLASLPLTQTQREKLTTTVSQANATLQQALNQYQQLMQNQRAQLILAYREQIRPAARKIALEKGYTVVLTTTDAVLYFDPQAADITDVVSQELKKNPPPAVAPVAPPPAKTTTNEAAAPLRRP